MKLSRLPHDPALILDFFQEALETLGAVCERPWHDRLRLVAEGAAARLWRDDGALVDAEIAFPPAGETGPRDAAREVYPGCPLTFRLAETLRGVSLPLQRVCFKSSDAAKPTPEVSEKLWRAQFPGTTRWKMETPFRSDWHFSLLALARCEIQAIDQHWSLHRVAVSLRDGARDEALAANLGFCAVNGAPPGAIPWPVPAVLPWHEMLRKVLAEELAGDLALIRQRQENYLQRELERIDAYFENYERELGERLSRSHRDTAKVKVEERLTAARVEHQRRRSDQIQRHEISVIPRLDALLLIAEPAWTTTVVCLREHEMAAQPAMLIPRSRRWLQCQHVEKPDTA
ncbi:MAG: hypothetical protein HY360_16630 [Verrucomicrobia bacterium]|nr:hypothetical protein [Verrucomicrobiota bacterium]